MIRTSTAVTYFKTQASNFNRSSLLLVASAATCFIAGAFSEKEKKDYNVVMGELKDAITEEGIQMAQMYKYIGLARQLVLHLVKKHPLNDGPIHDVLDAKTPRDASNVLVEYVTGEEVTSLDSLGAFLGGRYQRSDTRAPRAGQANGDDTADTGDTGAPRSNVRHIPVTTTPAEVISAINDNETIAETVAEAVFDAETFTRLVAEVSDPAILQTMIETVEARLEQVIAEKKRNARKPRKSAPRGRTLERIAA